jgi:hypothetical protein
MPARMFKLKSGSADPQPSDSDFDSSLSYSSDENNSVDSYDSDSSDDSSDDEERQLEDFSSSSDDSSDASDDQNYSFHYVGDELWKDNDSQDLNTTKTIDDDDSWIDLCKRCAWTCCGNILLFIIIMGISCW